MNHASWLWSYEQIHTDIQHNAVYNEVGMYVDTANIGDDMIIRGVDMWYDDVYTWYVMMCMQSREYANQMRVVVVLLVILCITSVLLWYPVMLQRSIFISIWPRVWLAASPEIWTVCPTCGSTVVHCVSITGTGSYMPIVNGLNIIQHPIAVNDCGVT